MRIRSGLLAVVAVLALGMAKAVLAASPNGYLHPAGVKLDFVLPPPPVIDGDLQRLDLAVVRAAQASDTALSRQEATADARAYSAPDIVQRFQDAAAEPLSPELRPLLVSLLTGVVSDVSAYGGDAKALYERDRPYVGHSDIALCDAGPPAHPIDPKRSYPSGHAMNGATVALVLADVFPEREARILARGAHYGDNRLVCGAHFPSDVLQGQRLAIAYVTALRADSTFKADLACAEEEEAVMDGKAAGYSPACKEELKRLKTAAASPTARTQPAMK